ncbi:protein AATF [Galleria mellonella]|uniref:Protein AATF n=1 Tax=Galleria mellonella TaxID=7137 RepID=A0A6J1X811_GALME|nr:protein AATF [Galleria mellonella]
MKMKFKQKRSIKSTLSDKIADALTVKPRADIEDDQVFGTKPRTVTRGEFSSDSEDEAAISDFRKRNVNLLSEISRKYEGKIVSRKEHEQSIGSSDSEDSDVSDEQLTATNGQLTDSESEKKGTDSDDTDADNNIKLLRRKSNEASAHSGTDTSDDDYESDGYSISKFQKSTSQGSSDDDDDGDSGDEEGYDISQMEEPPKEEFEHVKRQNVSEEAKKGACVRNQLLIWEGLLEMRIHLQRCISTANQMPLPDTFEKLKTNNDFVDNVNATKTNVAHVLDKFMTLQSLLFKKFPETKNLLTNKPSHEPKVENKQESDEEIPSDTDNEEIPSDTDVEDNSVVNDTNSFKKNNTTSKKRKLEDYEKDIATSHKSFKTFRNTTIQKWNDKTRLATAANIKNAPTNTILQQISYILSDREKLIKRTQLKRSEYDIIGYKKSTDEENMQQNVEQNTVVKSRKDVDEYIPEIFDDSDFYHQLLRELIECKSADISDPVQLSRQWIALQQMRSKMKRKVDTKATKGRKIKYVVHNQLVNYMAPEKCNTWTDESTNELYNSLFGKMFENNNANVNLDLDKATLK